MISLSNLKMTNFESHENTEMQFSKVNVVTGGNGDGKSSIINAIMLCLSGDLPTKPYEQYIKTNTNKAIIELSFIGDDGSSKTTRKILENTGTKTELLSTNKIAAQIGTTSETLRTMSDTWYFVRYANDMSRRNVLSSVLSRKYTLEELIAVISSRDPEGIYANFIRANYSLLDNPKKSQMEVLYKIAYDGRAELKKRKESLETQIASLENKLSAYADIPMEIDTSVLERTTKHNSLIVSNNYNSKTIEDKKTTLTSYIAKIEDMKNTREVLATSILDKKTSSKEVEDLNSQLIILTSQLKGLTENLSIITKNGTAECPICGSPLTGVEDKVKSKIDDKKKAIDNLTPILENKKDTLSAQSKIDEIDNLISTATKKLDTMKADISNSESEILNINTEISKLESEGILTKEGLDASKNQAEINKLKGSLSTLRDQLIVVKEELTNFQNLTDIFNNKTIWTQLLSYNKDIFTDKLEEIVNLLIPKYTAHLDDQLNILFDGVNINTLSESEKFRVGISIQAALAIASGCGILMIDGSDIVTDPTNIIECINKLGSMEEIKTMIITSSFDFTKKNNRSNNSIKVEASHFHVTEGKVEKLENIIGSYAW